MMKLPFSLLLGTAAAAFPQAAGAQEVPEPRALTVTGNLTLVSDYRFRGVSQTGGDPAVQGSATLSHESGFYGGIGFSTVDFTRLGAAEVYGSQEVDLTAGWSREIASGITADLGLAYYAYPGGHVGKADFFETYGSLATTYGPARLKLGINYAWAQGSLADARDFYVYGSADAAIPGTPVTLAARLGYQDGPLAGSWIASGGVRHLGWDWSLGASATVLGRLTLGASYVGVSGPSLPGVTDDTVVASLSVAF